jgi:hypothetical protein
MRGEIGDYEFETYDDGIMIETPTGDLFIGREALERLAEVIEEVLEDE